MHLLLLYSQNGTQTTSEMSAINRMSCVYSQHRVEQVPQQLVRVVLLAAAKLLVHGRELAEEVAGIEAAAGHLHLVHDLLERLQQIVHADRVLDANGRHALGDGGAQLHAAGVGGRLVGVARVAGAVVVIAAGWRLAGFGVDGEIAAGHVHDPVRIAAGCDEKVCCALVNG